MSELRDLLDDLPLDLASLADLGVERDPREEAIEVHDTFGENARAKALHFRDRTGLPTLADDSGLVVDALGGRPGVRTKRFAPEELAERYGRDEANNRHLLDRLEGFPEGERRACYRCALAMVVRDASIVVHGEVCGRIGFEERGDGGFGYDPLFVVPGYEQTFAELPPEVKREMSHRARAVRELRPWIERWLEEGGEE